MARQTQNQDQSSEPLRDIQQGFNSGYDAATDKGRGDQTADESEELTNALNPIQPKSPTATKADQTNAQPDAAQKRQAERGGS